MIDTSRVQKELVEIEREKKNVGLSIKLHGDDLTHLCGTISGPIDTPYEGGSFLIDIRSIEQAFAKQHFDLKEQENGDGEFPTDLDMVSNTIKGYGDGKRRLDIQIKSVGW